jgi:hypothetical protein
MLEEQTGADEKGLQALKKQLGAGENWPALGKLEVTGGEEGNASSPFPPPPMFNIIAERR